MTNLSLIGLICYFLFMSVVAVIEKNMPMALYGAGAAMLNYGVWLLGK